MGFVVNWRAGIAGSLPKQAGRKERQAPPEPAAAFAGVCPGMSIFLIPVFQADLEMPQ